MNFSVYAGFCLQDVYDDSCIRFISFSVFMGRLVYKILTAILASGYQLRRVYGNLHF